MYSYEQIKTVHLEVTEKCQAGCALCARYRGDGSINHHLNMSELSISDARKIFPKEFIKQLKRMYMCGNFGDPIIAKDTLEIFEYFRYNNPKIILQMHTNGGARSSQWWMDLASIFYNQNSYVVFSIDGLEDTNHIYRRNVVWDNVINSAKAFIDAGGQAIWSFLVFKHNEHQIDQARVLSEKMGFKRFVTKKSSRFVHNPFHDYLHPPENEKYQNKNLQIVQKIKEQYGSYDSYLDKTDINCLVKDEKNIFVSAEGLVFPCCWLAADAKDQDYIDLKQTQIMNIIKNTDNINALKKSLKEILDSKIFDYIENSWSLDSMSCGKLRTCARTCDANFSAFKAQYD